MWSQGGVPGPRGCTWSWGSAPGLHGVLVPGGTCPPVDRHTRVKS